MTKLILIILTLISLEGKGQTDTANRLHLNRLSSGNLHPNDSSKFKFATATSLNGLTIQPTPRYWISIEKMYPHTAEYDFQDTWVKSYNLDQSLLWKYHFASDTLFVDTTKIKHIIYLKP